MLSRISSNLLVALHLLLSCSLSSTTTAWSPATFAVSRACARHRKKHYRSLYAQKPSNGEGENDAQQGSTTTTTVTTTQTEWQDEDAGAGVVGAQFFGGNKEKEEFYDPVAEAAANVLAFDTEETTTTAATSFDRFADRRAFDSVATAELSMAYQDLLNEVIAGNITIGDDEATALLDASLQWETPLSTATADKGNSPLVSLVEATQFYRRVNVAITSAKTLTKDENTFQLRWEIGLAWPTFWEPAILLTGSSKVTVKPKQNEGDRPCIVKQVDVLDDPDLVINLARQIVPRFWDMYHIGMTPTSEISPMWEKRLGGLGQNFVLYDVPSRWTWIPTLEDNGNRDDSIASFLPNHAFTTAIRTMGPKKDAYIPTTPTQIEIEPAPNGPNKVSWKVPLSVELQAEREWPLCQSSSSSSSSSNDAIVTAGSEGSSVVGETGGSYAWQPARRVATLPTGLIRPQDEGITELRKRLYERVTSAGLKPKLNSNGRPCFFFWSATTKTCFTDKGLGMAVYEYRPEFAQSNHVGLELEELAEIKGGN